MWVLKTRERHLRAFPSRRVDGHSADLWHAMKARGNKPKVRRLRKTA